MVKWAREQTIFAQFNFDSFEQEIANKPKLLLQMIHKTMEMEQPAVKFQICNKSRGSWHVFNDKFP